MVSWTVVSSLRPPSSAMTSIGYVKALTDYRYDGDDRSRALQVYVEQFLDYTGAAVSAAERFRLAAIDIHERWRHSASGFRSDSSIHRAVDLVVENPVISARFLADNLGVSSVSAQKLVKKLCSVGIVRARHRQASEVRPLPGR